MLTRFSGGGTDLGKNHKGSKSQNLANHDQINQWPACWIIKTIKMVRSSQITVVERHRKRFVGVKCEDNIVLFLIHFIYCNLLPVEAPSWISFFARLLFWLTKLCLLYLRFQFTPVTAVSPAYLICAVFRSTTTHILDSWELFSSWS